MSNLTSKLALVSVVCGSLVLTACQTPDLGQKDPEKATKVRTQLAVEYLKTVIWIQPNVRWIRHWKPIRVIRKQI